MNQIAPRLRIQPLIDEYDRKVEAVDHSIQAFEQALADVRAAATVQGTYGQSLGSHLYAPSKRAILESLATSAWRHLYQGLHIDKIAPAGDRARFEREIENPPAFTMDNIRASFGQYIAAPRQHILRGLAEAFCALDDAYKSHSKVKIGVEGLPKRIILPNCLDSWSYGRARAVDTINALRLVQDRGPRPWHTSTTKDENGEDVAVPGIADCIANGLALDGLTFKAFKNGNLHVIFDDQARRDINLALAEYYGDVLPDTPDEDPKARPGTAVSKDLQYYPSPAQVADELAAHIPGRGAPKILEPSCGCGRVLDAIRRVSKDAIVFGYEVHTGRAQACRDRGHSVLARNFLDVPATPEFDLVLMNPPFCGRHYLKHIRHAVEFLKPGGKVVSVLPASAHYDHGDLPQGGRWRDLPVGSFAESGTNIPTGIWSYTKDGAP